MFTYSSLTPCSLLTLENLTLPEFVKKFLIFIEAEISFTFSRTPVSVRYPEPVLSKFLSPQLSSDNSTVQIIQTTTFAYSVSVDYKLGIYAYVLQEIQVLRE